MRTLIAKTRARVAARTREEAGALLAEYGLLVVGIAAVALASVYALGGPVAGLYEVVFP